MKITLPKLFAILIFFSLIGQKSYGQAPNIGYGVARSYTINVPITTLSPTNSGGAVPAITYGTTTTFAGSTTAVASRLNGNGTAAGFNGPRGISITAAGTFYVADEVNNQIRRITPAAVVSLLAGNTGGNPGSINNAGTNASFDGPFGIVSDGTAIYIADYNNNQIRKVTTAGTVTLFAGSGTGTGGSANNTTGTAATFTGPAAIAYDATSNSLFVSDFVNNQIRKISLTGTNAVTLFAGNAAGTAGSANGPGTTAASFTGPNGIAVDASGNVFVADQNNNLIRKITPAGVVTTVAGTTTAGSADGLGTAASFTTPRGITIDLSGYMYITDSGNSTVRRISPAGLVTTIAGLAGSTGFTDGVGTAARFNQSRGIDLDPTSGDLYVADHLNNNIRKIITTGYIISPALPAGLTFNPTNGQITGTPTALSAPTDYTIIAFNKSGSSVTTLNLAVVNLITVTDANAAANNVTQGTLRPGQTDIVLFGFGVSANTPVTISNFNIYNTYSQTSANSYFSNTTGKIYRSTSSAFSFATATLINSATVTFGFDAASGIKVSGLTEALTNTGLPTYYFIVGDFRLDYYGTLPATSQFQFTTAQTNPIVLSSPTTTNYSLSNNPLPLITGLNYPLATAAVTTTANNGAQTPSPLSFGQTDIILFSFKVDVQGIVNINQFDITSTISANPFFLNGKLYRSTTANFIDAIQVPFVAPATAVTVSFSSTNTSITGFNSAMSSYNGTGTYYYFLVGDLTNTNSVSSTGPITFTLSTNTNPVNPIAITQSNPYRQFPASPVVTGTAFTISPTYVWVGTTNNNFNTSTNYRTLNNTAVAAGILPATTAVYIPTVFQGNTITLSPVLNNATTSIASLTFGGASPPALLLNGKTLSLSSKLVVAPGTTATITGTGNVNLTNATALTSGIEAGSVLNLTGAAILNNAGTFTMESTSALNLSGNSTTANTSAFILKSDANGSAIIGPLSGTSAFTGNYQVQRYVTGGSVNRGYRLFSSPVYDASVITSGVTNKVYDLAFLRYTAFITGTATTSTAGSGMDNTVAANPTIYLYRENIAPTNASFTGGNFRGVNAINNTTVYNIGIDNEPSSPYNIPTGNGFMFFYRGDRNAATFAQETVSTYIPTAATFTNTGILNQGNIIVRNWNTPTVNTLSYTNTGTVLNSAVRGFTLVGNPYASSIDWDKWVVTPNTGALPQTAVSNIIYLYNVKLKGYSVYQAGNGGAATNKVSNAANIIPSGQGFFVKATAPNAALTFTEAAKVTTQVAPANLLMATSDIPTDAPLQYMRVQLLKDTVNYDDGLVFFKDGAKTDYVLNEDATYLRGNNTVALSMRSSDNIALAINRLELPKKNKRLIPLSVTVATNGIYQLNLPEIKNIPSIYQIWLMDAYKKDSLDLRKHPSYKFNVINTDATTFGANRFTLLIRQDPDKALRLLDFSADKVTTGAQLSWIAENESNYTNYTVERSADGGKTFDVVGGFASSSLGKYVLLDKAPVIGLNQYRLKQDDINGTITYSKVINLMYSNTNNNIIVSNISVYPNPATSIINVEILPQQNTGLYNIKITNGVGHLVRSATVSQNIWQANVSNLLPGTYFVQVLNNADKKIIGNSKFVKNH